jgi:predicted GH43/DUF377 family glycosyl hydrolase
MIIERYKKNPILIPNKDQAWEAEAVFNGCPIKKGNKIFLLYRAISLPHFHSVAGSRFTVSDIGIVESKDGINFYNRRRFIVPEYDWEKFGCEDPRITKLDNKYYIFYTALGSWPPKPESIRIGLAVSKDLEKIERKRLVTSFNSKAMALFPEKINGKIWAILTVHTDQPPSKICFATFKKEEEIWSESFWKEWYKNFDKYSLSLQRRPQDHIETGTPPIKTKFGWLLFYSYIKNYFYSERTFCIEAVLLDLNNPSKIVARTDFPILYPEEYYEKYGMVPNVIFPVGAIIKDNWINLYYGAADTTCCLVKIELMSFLDHLINRENKNLKLVRAKENPIISPIKEHNWESKATFNPAAIYLKNKVRILYRAISDDNTSVLGYAESRDGIHIDYRSDEPVFVPREKFEEKLQPNGNSGVEDPRIVKMGDRIYVFYTAFDGKNPPRVALTSIKEDDFLSRRWNWAQSIVISPPGFDDKDATMFPAKIKGKFLIIHRIGNEINLSFSSNLNFGENNWLEEYRWIKPRKGWWDSKKVGIATTPIKTKHGWLILYHGISEEDGFYRVGAVLTDLLDPIKIIGRTIYPIFEPETSYEKEGQVNNVVFPCGAVVIGEKLFVYYGGADKIVGVSFVELNKLLRIFKRNN